MPYKGSVKNKADKARWQRDWRKRNRDKVRLQWDEWQKKTGHDPKKHSRQWHLGTQYGITQADYDALFEKQHGLCAICGEPPTEGVFVVDHNHETHEVRGLLHRTCNSAIGLLKDDPELIRKALEYLEDTHAV